MSTLKHESEIFETEKIVEEDSSKPFVSEPNESDDSLIIQKSVDFCKGEGF